MKNAHVRDEVDAEIDRMKWLRMARKASARGIGDIAAPPGGWPGGAPSTPKNETPPARVSGKTIRYAEPELPAELAHPDMAPFRLGAARAATKPAVKGSKPARKPAAKPARARASAGAVDTDVAVQRGRRNAARKITAVLAGMK
jgi:hypothetical protein